MEKNCETVPKVQIEFMNEVHCEEFLLMEELNSFVQESILLNEVHSEITPHLENIIQHTVEHFDRENRYMQEYNFPPYLMHSGEHEQALRNLKMVELEWKNNQDLKKLDQYINQVWRPWFSNHILTMDTITANFLAQFNIDFK